MTGLNPLLRKTHVEAIEDGIVEAIRQGGLSSKYFIASFPDDPDQFDLVDHDKVALVQYTGSRYDAPRETGGSAQTRRVEFAIHIYLRRLNTPVRGMREIEQLRLVVQGLQLEGTELFITRDGLVDQDDALWRYVIEVACWIPAVPLTRPRPTPFINEFTKPEGA